MISIPGPNLSSRQFTTPWPSYAPSARNRFTSASMSVSKSGSAVSSPTCSVVNSVAAIPPVSGSGAMWSLRHVLRAFLMPCFSSYQLLPLCTFRPVLSTMSVIGLLSTIWSKASDFSRKNIQTCAEGAHEPLNPLTLVGGGSVAARRFWAMLSPLPRRDKVEKSGTTRSMPIRLAIDRMKP